MEADIEMKEAKTLLESKRMMPATEKMVDKINENPAKFANQVLNSVKIEPYRDEYREDISRLCQLFVKESLEAYGLSVTENKLETMVGLCKDLSFCLVVKGKCVGVIAGMIVEGLTNDERTLQEIIWYVDKGHRANGIRLLDAFEDMAKHIKVKRVLMCLMQNSMASRLDKFYRNLGYVPFETQYMKEI